MNIKFKGLFIICILFINYSLFSEIFPFRKNNKYGLMDQDFNVIKKAEYDFINPEENNKYFILGKTVNNFTETEISDENGNKIYKTNRSVRHIWNDYFVLEEKNGEKLFCINSDFEIFAYQFISSQEPKIPFRKEVYRQYINIEGNLLFPNRKFRRSYGFYENRAINLNSDWEYEIIDGQGNYIFGKDFSEVGQHYSEGLLYAKEKKGKTGFVDYDGNFKIEIPLKESDEDNLIATNFYKGRAIINTVDKGICIINKKGNILKSNIPISWFYDFCEDYAIVSLSNKSYNYLSLEGTFISNKNFEFAKDFCNGYAIISLNGKDGLIDKYGKIHLLNSN